MKKILLGVALLQIGISYFIIQKLKTIMADQTQATADVKAISAQLQKIGTESATMLEKITALEEAAANQGNLSPELTEAIAEAKAQAQIVDDLVPDAPEGGA